MSQAEARNQDCVWLSQLDSRAQALGSQGSLTLCCCTKHISRELIRGRKAATLILDANIARNGLTISVFMVRILQKTFKHNDPLPSHSGKCRLPPRPFKIYSFEFIQGQAGVRENVPYGWFRMKPACRSIFQALCGQQGPGIRALRDSVQAASRSGIRRGAARCPQGECGELLTVSISQLPPSLGKGVAAL